MSKICKVTINDEPFLANRGELLLDWALMNGIDLPHDCRSGICGACRVRMVDGQVFGALLAEQLLDWLGPRAVLRTLHFRFKALVFAGETVRCVATVTAIEPDPDGAGDLVTIESTVEVVADKGRVAVAPAGATVVVPR